MSVTPLLPEWIGSFGSSGSPEIKVTISGVLGDGQEFTAVIHTGFTGFLSMPLVDAFPLGLLLYGTMNLVLADGSTSFRLTAFGAVVVEGEKRTGVIVLETGSSDVLLGMEFLKKFGRTLVVSPTDGVVSLYEPAKPGPAQEPSPPPVSSN